MYDDTTDTQYLLSFNTNTQTLNNEYSQMLVHVTDPCIAIDLTENYLFVNGGYQLFLDPNTGKVISNTQIYNFNTNEWILGPNMNKARRFQSCAFTIDYFVAISGNDGTRRMYIIYIVYIFLYI